MHLPTPPRDRMRTCRYCRWVDVRRRLGAWEDSLRCTSKWGALGRAGEGLSCCDFEREPGSDDEFHTDHVHLFAIEYRKSQQRQD